MTKGKAQHSATAGKPCMLCNTPNPCISEFSLKAEDQISTYPKNKEHRLVLLDEGEGVEVTIATVSKCANQHSDCPKTYLFDVSESTEKSEHTLFMQGTDQKKQTVKFKGNIRKDLEQSKLMAIGEYIFSIIGYPAFPWDTFAQPRQYAVTSEGCNNELTGLIDVYPSVEFTVVVAFKYDFLTKKLSDSEQRKLMVQKRKEAMAGLNKALPTNYRRQWRGWTKEKRNIQLTNKFSVDVELGLKVQQTEWSLDLANLLSRNKTRYQEIKGGLNNLQKFLDASKRFAIPAPNMKNSVREYKIADFTVQPLTIGLAYGYTRTLKNKTLIGEHFGGISSDPLFEIEFKIDLLQLIAAYCKSDKIVAKVREFLDKKHEKQRHYFSVECYLAVSLGISVKGGWRYLDEKNSSFSKDEAVYFDDKENKGYLKFVGMVAAEFKTKVLLVEGFLSAKASLVAEGGIQLDKHKDGLDIAGYHKGLKAKLAIEAQVDMDGNRGKNKNDESKKLKFEVEHEFTIAGPLVAEESHLRANLVGKLRDLPPLGVEVGALYAMGSNPHRRSDDNTIPYGASQQYEKYKRQTD